MLELCASKAKYDSVLRNDYMNIICVILQSGEEIKDFNMNQRNAKFNEEAVVKCERQLYSEEESYILRVEYETMFTTNKPLLLGSFVLSKIFVGSKQPRKLRSGLPVDVVLIEDHSKALLKMKTERRSEENIVSSPYPVLLKPEVYYIIQVGKFPDEFNFLEFQSNLIYKFKIVDTSIELQKNKISGNPK